MAQGVSATASGIHRAGNTVATGVKDGVSNISSFSHQRLLQFFALTLMGTFLMAMALIIGGRPPPYSDGNMRIVTLRVGTGRQKRVLDEGQIPNVRVVRVHVSTGYNRVEGNRRPSRNGPAVSSSPIRIANVTIRNLFVAVHRHIPS